MFGTNSTTGVGRWRENMYNKHQQLGCWMCFGVVCVWGVWGRSEMLITTVVTDYWSSSKQLLNAAPKGSASDLYGLSWLTWVTVWRSLFTFHWGGFVFKWVVRDSTWRSIKIIDHYDRLKALNWVLVCVCVCSRACSRWSPGSSVKCQIDNRCMGVPCNYIVGTQLSCGVWPQQGCWFILSLLLLKINRG